MKKNKDKDYDVRGILEQMELDLIVAMKTTLSRHNGQEDKKGFKFEQWQAAKLRDLQRFKRENKKILGKYNKTVEKLVDDTLISTYKVSQNNVNNIIKEIKKEAINTSINLPKEIETTIDADDIGLDSIQEVLEKVLEDTKLWKEVPIEESFFRINDNKFNALMETVDNDLKKANAAVLRRMDDVYRQTIFKTQVHYNMGNVTLDKAIDMATKDFLSKGIDAITYADGKKVNIVSYVEMALRTANHRAYLMGEGNKRQEIGLSLVVVSAHATSCKLCVPWQGLIIIDDVYSGGKKEDGPYQLLSVAMKVGFLHPQCRHNLNTYFPGITTLPNIPDMTGVEENYKREQQQRYIERQIKKYKRLKAGSLDEGNQKEYARQVREWQKIMREHLEENPQLRRAYRREKVY